MKLSIFSLAALLVMPTLARAERFLVKNPRGPILGKVIQKLHFGSNVYWEVEAPKFSNLLASFAPNSDHVSVEAKIRIPAGENDSANSNTTRAWHPDAMKYAELPQLRDGRNVIVAVLDTGVDYNHPALKDHIYISPAECDATDKTKDNDNNGFAGDCHGYDFDKHVGNPMDGDQHGTHCAGIIGASVDPVSNAQGVAPGVKILPVRIIGDEQTGFLSNAAAGIRYAVDNGARVLSSSWRVYKSWAAFDPSDANLQLLKEAIQYAGEHGAIFVAAAGNESLDMDKLLVNDPLYPAGFQGLNNMIVVAASDQKGDRAYFSNYGENYVSVAAPGDEIISTIPGGSWESMSGTSMATPLVAGAVARGLSGKLSMGEAIRKIQSTSNPATSWQGKVKAGGVIDLTKFLAE